MSTGIDLEAARATFREATERFASGR